MGVWVGNDDNSKMGGLTGGTVPALIWRDIMRVAADSLGSGDFQYPDVVLESSSGKSNPKLTSNGKKNDKYQDTPVDNQMDEVPMTIVTPKPSEPVSSPNSTVKQNQTPVTTAPVSAPVPGQSVQPIPLPMAVPNMN